MSKTIDGVLPRTNLRVRMLPGSPAPRSDRDEQSGPRGGRTGGQIESSMDKPLAPMIAPRGGWMFVRSSDPEDSE
jgi:hypothetical protein